MAQSADDLQWAMGFKEMFSIYCTQCKLNVNVEKKQNSLFFSKVQSRKGIFITTYFGNDKEFKYPGIVFSGAG